MNFQAPKGVSEYIPPRSAIFEFVREQLCAPAKSAGYKYMELPVFEDTGLFARGVGESTDIVTKEMYTFEDRGGRSITLRPEGTAGVMRAVIEHGLDRGQLPVKVLYSGAYFRAERPQKGRYRQFYQVGIEAIGLNDPLIDAEVIWLADQAFKNIGLKNYRLEITSLGDAESRAAHRKDLLKFYETLNLDEATASRAKLNPLRLFDDKRPEMVEAMSKAPKLLDYLNEDSKLHFEKVRAYLDALGVQYEINSKLVRGFDYYTGTTFEFIHLGLGAQSAIGGGGRYDKLMSELGGQDLSGIGWGLGVDRTLLAAEEEGVIPADLGNADLFIIPLGTQLAAIKIAAELRSAGKVVEIAFGDRGLKGAMKAADKSGAKYVLVLGENEVESGSVELKTMSSGDVKSVRISDLVNAI
ncbi:MAG: histidine--tRNA ligase [Candidatus Nanopelagicaceae bacterium]|jgi:histidyl-tRNA synthetase|nr:histidine--tRNA ligase [Candidatus Nanopelagicaceae bacterium]